MRWFVIKYKQLFARNYGVFTEQEQEKMRRSRVLVVGCGGIGGTVAVILARCGVEKFELVDFDEYEPTNVNRQIGCLSSTFGMNKAEVIGEQIREINPEAEVVVHPLKLSLDELSDPVLEADLVFPAADDFAFSLMLFRLCRQHGKPALFVLPAGTWANVSIIRPDSPTVEELHGIPFLPDYQSLKEMFETRKYKLGSYYLYRLGRWRKEYFRSFIDDDHPLAQVCPTVWLCSSLGAGEAMKVLTGRGKPVESPRYWSINEDKISIRRKNGFHMETVYGVQRRIFWKILQSPAAPLFERLQALWYRFL